MCFLLSNFKEKYWFERYMREYIGEIARKKKTISGFESRVEFGSNGRYLTSSARLRSLCLLSMLFSIHDFDEL